MTSSPRSLPRSIESIARCVLVRDGAVLLCGALNADGQVKYWYLPGGHIDPGETARQAVAREMLEEAGVPMDVGECVLVSENHFMQVRAKTGQAVRRHEYTLVFMATCPTATIESREDDLCFAWLPFASIAEAELRPVSHRAWLATHAVELSTGVAPALEFHVEQS